MPVTTMEVKDWEYVGEGGKHALFTDPKGTLLRVKKKVLAAAAQGRLVVTSNSKHDEGL